MCVSAFPRWFSGKESTCQCRRLRRQGFSPWVRKIPCSRKWHPTLVFLLEKSHGQRSLAGYSPSGRKESDKTEHACKHLFLTVRPLVNYTIPLSFWVFVYRLVVIILVQSSNTYSCPTFCPPHGLQHARLPCLSPGVCWDSCQLSPWYRPTVSSSSCPKSFPVSRAFPVS